MGIKIAPLVLIFIGVLTRLLPHPPNFAPISAIALFGACYLPRKYAFLIPVGALLVSDLFLGFYGFSMFFVYGSFILTGLIGLWLKQNRSLYCLLVAAITSSILFYLITNFGVWLDPGSSYTKDLTGLLNSYILALPFFKNTILGDLFYSGLFFLSYEVVLKIAKNVLSPVRG